ncbi:2-deoxystreptamine N-acetyl-D-glucosaminyltransferase [Pelagimonas phthalicica]|uniref:2-deoxystreptamine N-acetyl-D-glucosaminyltransferase n=1 Tax=Pelagimonas phthalicica TaxID=1037362 RepID=A0A238JHF4_9RHOB|nr:glycosyltransferase family 4 protein [Pelagimonas phthalicica]TDS89249.1 glycosyltransferase involved in cell wall biosynthesis [Pelagimonas phthalicica]SMX29577.1 2-deoxystreptamine N-acetyl-D-glucosaminyltransferase [Pelagimonas phthalicica]
MHIALVGYMFGDGGIQTHTDTLAQGLAQKGHEVKVITPAEMANHKGDPITANGYEIIVQSGLKDALGGFGLRGWAEAMVVAGTGWNSMIGTLRSGPNCRKIFFEVMSGKPGGAKDPRRLVHLGFDAIVGQGKPVEDRFCKEFKWNGPRCTIAALPGELALPQVNETPPAGDKPLRFAHFGRLARHKNVSLLVEQWDAYGEGATLDIWGGGEDADHLKDLIAQKGLGDQIKLKGRYPSGDAYSQLLTEYDLTLLPTIGEEGAPLVLLESMACGVPFVANGVGGIPDYTNQDCSVTSKGIDEFMPLLQEMIARIRTQGINRPRIQNFYANTFSPSVLTDRWEAYLSEQVALN